VFAGTFAIHKRLYIEPSILWVTISIIAHFTKMFS